MSVLFTVTSASFDYGPESGPNATKYNGKFAQLLEDGNLKHAKVRLDVPLEDDGVISESVSNLKSLQ